MIGEIRSADASGNILSAGSRGHGFSLTPAIPFGSTDKNPGGFPVKVKFKRTGELFDVPNADAWYWEDQFQGFDILGCNAGDSWHVAVFDKRGDGKVGAGAKARAVVKAQAATAVPTAAPSAAGDGFANLPGQTAWELFFAGTLTPTVTLWQRTLAGVWCSFGTDEDIDPAAETAATRLVYAPAGRFYVQASGLGLTVEMQRVFEVG